MEKVLVIAEDTSLETRIVSLMEPEGYEVDVVGLFDYDIFKNEKYSLIISEIPACGTDVYFRNLISIFNCKVIVVVKSESLDVIRKCVSEGVDDMIFSPIRRNELLIKTRYLVHEVNSNFEEYEGALFSTQEYKVRINNKWIHMTKNEYRICKTLAQNSGMIYTKNHIYDFIYDFDKDTKLETITEYIYSIRKKCKDVSINPIKTIWGIGYRWNYRGCVN